jgi:hypothetical protein
MSKTWKITNTSERPVKLTIALGGANNPGRILNPGEMVLSIDKLTGPLDKQCRSKFVEIDENFDNSELNLPLGVVMKDIESAIKDIENYSEK